MSASALQRIEGVQLVLRLVEPTDAEYIFGLRSNPSYNAYLSEVSGTADDQRRWIESYKERESFGIEYYFVIERFDGVRCGVVRLYEIDADTFTWGSWILDHNKPAKAALESAVLSFGAGFGGLGRSRALLDCRLGNSRALNFYRRFGMAEVRSDKQNVYFEYPKATYETDLTKHMSTLKSSLRE